MNYITENVTIFDEKGFNPLGLYAFLLPSKNGEAAHALKDIFKKVDFSRVEALKAPNNIEFLEFLIDLVATKVPKDLKTLSEVDVALKAEIPTYAGVKYLLTKVKRSVFVKLQNTSPYGATTPLLLYALKKGGYPYMHWDIKDPLLPEYLGEDLAPLIEFRSRTTLKGKLMSAIEIMMDKAKLGGPKHAWYTSKAYPNDTPVKGQLSKAVGVPLKSAAVAVILGSWCNHNNPNNIGIAIYNIDNWDDIPANVVRTTQKVDEESPW